MARRDDRHKLLKKGVPSDQKYDDMISAIVRLLTHYRTLERKTPRELKTVKVRFYTKPRFAFSVLVNGSIIL